MELQQKGSTEQIAVTQGSQSGASGPPSTHSGCSHIPGQVPQSKGQDRQVSPRIGSQMKSPQPSMPHGSGQFMNASCTQTSSQKTVQQKGSKEQTRPVHMVQSAGSAGPTVQASWEHAGHSRQSTGQLTQSSPAKGSHRPSPQQAASEATIKGCLDARLGE